MSSKTNKLSMLPIETLEKLSGKTFISNLVTVIFEHVFNGLDFSRQIVRLKNVGLVTFLDFRCAIRFLNFNFSRQIAVLF